MCSVVCVSSPTMLLIRYLEFEKKHGHLGAKGTKRPMKPKKLKPSLKGSSPPVVPVREALKEEDQLDEERNSLCYAE
ncbi:hypothetical protein H5410_045529 [Solanum commersonii]|uniref:Uncharacterized protein n=1 Tax=Solanum commersonii TaxID=4109 RepID=A0A9J5XBW2_SOLCO|nr:hypothetical protein H5410_045529 [Solanum commersonii]